MRPMFLAAALALPVIAALQPQRHLRVCITPDDGFWMINDSASALFDIVPFRWGASLPTFQAPRGAHALRDDWPLDGFAADSLLKIVQNMGPEWSFEVTVYPTYTRALYAVTQEHACNISFVPFTETPARAYCGGSTDTLQGCIPAPNGSAPEPRHGCCAEFATSMMSTTIGAIIKDSTAHADPKTDIDFLSTLAFEFFQILSWTMVGIIVVAHVVWLSERTSPKSNIYRDNYVHGIADAMWSGFVGYSGGLAQAPSTLVARVVALIETYLHLIAFAMLTSVITSRITSATLQPELLYARYSDFPATWVACVPSLEYIYTYDYIGRLQAYAPEDLTLQSCMKDFKSGKADLVICDEPMLRHEIMKSGKNADMRVVKGPSSITLSPVLAANKHNSFQHHFEQAAIQFFSNDKLVAATHERYFPTGNIVEEQKSLNDVTLEAYIGSIFVPMGLLVIFLAFYISIRLTSVHKAGRLDCGRRVAVVIKNMTRKSTLESISRRKAAAAPALPQHIQELFDALDENHDGTLDGDEIDKVIKTLQDSDAQISQHAHGQLNRLVVRMLDMDVNNCISKKAFAEAYEAAMRDSKKDHHHHHHHHPHATADLARACSSLNRNPNPNPNTNTNPKSLAAVVPIDDDDGDQDSKKQSITSTTSTTSTSVSDHLLGLRQTLERQSDRIAELQRQQRDSMMQLQEALTNLSTPAGPSTYSRN